MRNIRLIQRNSRIIDESWSNAMKAKRANPLLGKDGQPAGVYNVDFSASNRALELLGKEIGMFKEAKGPDLFDKLSSEQVRVLKALLDEWGESEHKSGEPRAH